MVMFDFRRIGDLQDYGEPYVSLYVDQSDKSLYMSIKPECRKLSYILLCVTPAMVNTYMQGELSLRELMRNSSILLQRTKSGGRWTVNPVSVQMAQDVVEDDDVYEPEYCFDKCTIEHYLNNMK